VATRRRGDFTAAALFIFGGTTAAPSSLAGAFDRPSSFRYARHAERDVANPSLSAIEPVSAPAKRKLGNGGQRPAPETRPRLADIGEKGEKEVDHSSYVFLGKQGSFVAVVNETGWRQRSNRAGRRVCLAADDVMFAIIPAMPPGWRVILPNLTRASCGKCVAWGGRLKRSAAGRLAYPALSDLQLPPAPDSRFHLPEETKAQTDLLAAQPSRPAESRVAIGDAKN
jgi:hypothetical protein